MFMRGWTGLGTIMIHGRNWRKSEGKITAMTQRMRPRSKPIAKGRVYVRQEKTTQPQGERKPHNRECIIFRTYEEGRMNEPGRDPTSDESLLKEEWSINSVIV